MSSKSTLTRSKSIESLHVGNYEVKCRRFCDYYHDNHSQSESSLDVCVIVENRSDVSSTEDKLVAGDMSRASDEGLSVLERKITKLTDILSEQHDLLRSLKDELTTSKNVLRTFTASENPDWLRETTQTLEDLKELLSGSFDLDIQANGAENLLDAIQRSQVQRTDREIRDVLNKFLQSDDLKDRIATATAESVKEVICSTFSETFPAAYLPVLEQSHRRLLRHVTRTLENAFNELEAGSEGLFKSVHRTSRSLRIALEKHQALLDANKTESIFDNFQDSLELILKNEFKEWREKLVTLLLPEPQIENNSNLQNGDLDLQINNSSYSASSPPQPADPERSIIDQLMKSAEISKRIKEGDINESFEEALSSSDLSLVVAACKAADPAQIFTPSCSLKQSVLLSLIQQLATDMVHDTQLKCRYLEEAIINLNPTDQVTRTHLPLVVGEVQKHLSKFIQLYPCHVANRRINLIIMAATNLLK